MSCFNFSLQLCHPFRALKTIRNHSTSLQLPWIKAHNPEFKHPGFCVGTQVRASNVCDGHGRFAMEFIPKNKEIARIPLVYVKDIQDSNMNISDNMCFMVGDSRELEYMVDLYSNEANVSPEVVRTGFGHFMGAPTVKGFCHFFSSSICRNHMPTKDCNSSPPFFDLNCITNGESVAFYALNDIQDGEELLSDYEAFIFPQWFMDWCTDHQITNVRMWLNDEYPKTE